MELRAALSTLLERDRHPGEIAGWGPVTAEVARAVVRAQRGAEWRYAVTDADVTRRRPHRGFQDSGPQDSGPPPCRGGIVELQVPLALLNQLAADPAAQGAWAAVITDIADRYARRGTVTQDDVPERIGIDEDLPILERPPPTVPPRSNVE